MNRTLPHKSPRSRGEGKRSTGRSAADLKKRQVQPPKLFVEVISRDWRGTRQAEAKIRVRRGCYRYLCWRDGLLKREFYLGKIKNLTPQIPRGAAGLAPTSAGADRDRAGVQK